MVKDIILDHVYFLETTIQTSTQIPVRAEHKAPEEKVYVT